MKPQKIRITPDMIINDMGLERVENFFCEFDTDGDPLYGVEPQIPQVHPRHDHWWVGQTALSCGFWVMMCQSRLINCSKCAPLIGNIDNGEGMHVWRLGEYGISVYLTQFCYECKTVLKNEVGTFLELQWLRL